MSLYGYERDTTPRLNEWAKEAVVFENAFAQSSWTLPVATSIFTSLYPYTHKIMDRNIYNTLDSDIITFPEIVESNGYRTAAFTGGLDYYRLFSFMKGFKEFDSNPPFTGFDVTLSQAQDWIEKNMKNRFFLMIHGYDTHCPFTPPQEFRGVFSDSGNASPQLNEELCYRGYQEEMGDKYKVYSYRNKTVNRKPNPFPVEEFSLTQGDTQYLEALYDEEVLAIDQKVSRFLEALPKSVLDETIIMIYSDHGEMFGRHGRFGRAGTIRGTLYDDVLKIPLIIKIPHQGGRRITNIVQLIDIMPTLMDILKIDFSSDDIQGKSFVGLLRGDRGTEQNKFSYAGTIFGITSNRVDLFYGNRTLNESIRNLEWKLIHELIFDESDNVIEETYELYDIVYDPHELIDRKDEEPIVFGQLKGKLQEWHNETLQFVEETDNQTQTLPDELLEAARERGYW